MIFQAADRAGRNLWEEKGERFGLFFDREEPSYRILTCEENEYGENPCG
jgi:hypothetical protein